MVLFDISWKSVFLPRSSIPLNPARVGSSNVNNGIPRYGKRALLLDHATGGSITMGKGAKIKKSWRSGEKRRTRERKTPRKDDTDDRASRGGFVCVRRRCAESATTDGGRAVRRVVKINSFVFQMQCNKQCRRRRHRRCQCRCRRPPNPVAHTQNGCK